MRYKELIMKRNQIDIWRLPFMFIVCILHTGALLTEGYPSVFFSGGYIAVEFFFIIAGYYLASAVSAMSPPLRTSARCTGTETYQFTLRRAKRMYPEFLCGFILTVVLDSIIYKHPIIFQIKRLLKSGVYELSLLHMANPHSSNEVIFSVAWYISALLFATFIIFPCLREFPDLFKNYVSPLLMMMYLCISGSGEDILIGNMTIYGVLMGGTIRAVAEMA